MKFCTLKWSTIELTKSTIQTFPCINICYSDFENGEFKWFKHSKGKMWDSHCVTIHMYDSIEVAIQVQCFYFILALVTSPE